jgi:hypothetical protein
MPEALEVGRRIVGLHPADPVQRNDDTLMLESGSQDARAFMGPNPFLEMICCH